MRGGCVSESEVKSSQTPLPSVFEHCQVVYKHLFSTSKKETLDDQDILVWEGFLTQVFEELHYPVPYFTKIRKELMRMGCIHQLRRGGGTATSKWMLIRPPERAHWENTHVTRERDKRRSSMTPQEQRVVDLSNRVQRLETALGLAEVVVGE
jgi:hypothetical protein